VSTLTLGFDVVGVVVVSRASLIAVSRHPRGGAAYMGVRVPACQVTGCGRLSGSGAGGRTGGVRVWRNAVGEAATASSCSQAGLDQTNAGHSHGASRRR
jgi:hypothetical protein